MRPKGRGTFEEVSVQRRVALLQGGTGGGQAPRDLAARRHARGKALHHQQRRRAHQLVRRRRLRLRKDLCLRKRRRRRRAPPAGRQRPAGVRGRVPQRRSLPQRRKDRRAALWLHEFLRRPHRLARRRREPPARARPQRQAAQQPLVHGLGHLPAGEPLHPPREAHPPQRRAHPHHGPRPPAGGDHRADRPPRSGGGGDPQKGRGKGALPRRGRERRQSRPLRAHARRHALVAADARALRLPRAL